MKKIFFFASLMMLSFSGFGQANYPINYQAVVRDGAGNLVPNAGTVNFRFSVLEGNMSGPVLYSETQSTVLNNDRGLVNLAIGDGTPVVGLTLAASNFSDNTNDKYLKVEVDITGGTAFVDLGTSKLQGVPFANNALYANYALNAYWDKTTSSSPNIYYNVGNVNIGASTTLGTSLLNVEEAVSNDHVVSVIQTGTVSSAYQSAIYARNDAAGLVGVGVHGAHAGSGWGLYGTAAGALGTGVVAEAATAMYARTTATNGISIDLDGYLKVSGTKTAFKTPALVSPAAIVTLSYGGAAATDILMVTPVNGSTTTMPSWALYWTGSAWQILNMSDDGIPSNFPAGTSFNILVIKQ
jgi:hypothetical protein